ncbi:hypothetical protein EDM56_15395 [Brevibacillus fluminis]|uniref:Cysteine-rich CWC family protein n=1 Tax=Brevibacillus fluminis TaxID=511487 RepID=A0A3M8DGF1_9BACL|nr:cysteine-rich CWC family protein [Brevibacillus fluminis]RNB87078.1 hypothetical protein EDM56_15395 [Brevibacillus fluminis]
MTERNERNERSVDASRCPLCGNDNSCGALANATECWCYHTVFPKEIFERIAPEQRRKACICKSCVDAFTDPQRTSR